MLSYVRDIQRQEIRIQLDCVKHQDMVSSSFSSFTKCVITLRPGILYWNSLKSWPPLQAGTYIGDEHKGYFSGDAALKAGGKDNTMNQFEVKVGNLTKHMLESRIRHL